MAKKKMATMSARGQQSAHDPTQTRVDTVVEASVGKVSCYIYTEGCAFTCPVCHTVVRNGEHACTR